MMTPTTAITTRGTMTLNISNMIVAPPISPSNIIMKSAKAHKFANIRDKKVVSIRKKKLMKVSNKLLIIAIIYSYVRIILANIR